MRRLKSTYITLGIAILLSLFFIGMAVSKEPTLLDLAAADWAKHFFTQSSYSFFHGIAELGDKVLIGMFVFFMVIWLAIRKRDFLGILVLILAVALSNEVSKWLKELVARERPEMGAMEESFSFPSGHAMVGFVLYMLIAYFLIRHLQTTRSKWWIGSIAALLIILIGLSRLVVGVHYLTDVLGGYSLGMVWTILWILLYEMLYERMTRK